jgi:hypothetical protein
MKVEIRPAQQSDVATIVADIREADAVEMRLLGTDPEAALREARQGLARKAALIKDLKAKVTQMPVDPC